MNKSAVGWAKNYTSHAVPQKIFWFENQLLKFPMMVHRVGMDMNFCGTAN